MDFNHNRLVLLAKEWYNGKLMIDFYYNDQFIGYITVQATWADLFNSDSSDNLIIDLIRENDKLKDYEAIFEVMNLSEEKLLFQSSYFQLYVTVPFHQKAILKVCRADDKKVLQSCSLNAYVYQEIYDSCMEYLDGLDTLADYLIKFCECQNK